MHQLPPALAALGAYAQFIVYRVQPHPTKPGKLDKFPCDFRTGAVVDAHDPAFWTTAQNACNAAATLGPGHGVGFTFTDADPFYFVDLDNALLPDGSGWKPHVGPILAHLAGAAVEVSVSGRGLHIIGTGRPPPHGVESSFGVGGLYHTGRYVALTGTQAQGDAATDNTAALPLLVETYWPPRDTSGNSDGWGEPGPVAGWRGPTDDATLLERAKRAQSAATAFGDGVTFTDLWEARHGPLGKRWPDPQRPYDASSADAALAQRLAFWTGNDSQRIVRLMRQSALVRDKWDRDDYMRRTVMGAIARQTEVLTDRQLEPVTSAPPPASDAPMPTAVTGNTFAGFDTQLELFAGCVYVRDSHRAVVPGSHIPLKPDQFRVHYGGYTFTLDNRNDKTSRDAWEAFTQSQIFRCPRADGTCFRPDLSPGAIIRRNGRTLVNTYWPAEVERKVGDPEPFLAHMRRVLPDERDREILMCYMAACVQHKGIKFQWAPLIQGAEGNGKSLFSRCVAEAVGSHYTHWPKASKLAAQFNAWMVGKLFYAVEDIYTPTNKQEVIEELKTMITGGDGLEIEAKGVDQVSSDVCGNFLLNTNHKDAIKLTIDMRRYCIMFCAQQSAADVARDGMGGDYFPNLYNWLRAEGYAIVNELLHTYPIPDHLNPARGCQRAPVSSTTHLAIEASEGSIEQEVREAIAQGLPGFTGPWISSIKLAELLERIGKARSLPHTKRLEMLEGMGYIRHPGLAGGRVNNPVLPEGGKPILFVRKGTPEAAMTEAKLIGLAYESANNHSTAPVLRAFGRV